jgi:hypothetical protein
MGIEVTDAVETAELVVLGGIETVETVDVVEDVVETGAVVDEADADEVVLPGGSA